MTPTVNVIVHDFRVRMAVCMHDFVAADAVLALVEGERTELAHKW